MASMAHIQNELTDLWFASKIRYETWIGTPCLWLHVNSTHNVTPTMMSKGGSWHDEGVASREFTIINPVIPIMIAFIAISSLIIGFSSKSSPKHKVSYYLLIAGMTSTSISLMYLMIAGNISLRSWMHAATFDPEGNLPLSLKPQGLQYEYSLVSLFSAFLGLGLAYSLSLLGRRVAYSLK
jgi:hypothetical protein